MEGDCRGVFTASVSEKLRRTTRKLETPVKFAYILSLKQFKIVLLIF